MLNSLDNSHADSSYEQALKTLIDGLEEMLTHNQTLVQLAIEGMDSATPDNTRAKEIDRRINALQAQIERNVQQIISRYGPQLVELRFTLASLKIAGYLERSGDHAKNTVKRLKRAEGQFETELYAVISKMLVHIEAGFKQLAVLLQDFSEKNATVLWAGDDNMDTLYKQAIMTISTHMRDGSLPDNDVSHALFIAKNLERIADHTVGIAAELYYVHTGERIEN